MGTSRVRTLGSLVRVSGASDSAIAQGHVCAAEPNEKELAEYGFVESHWGREQGKGSPRPFSGTFKKTSDQKGKLFDTHEDFAVTSPHYIFFGISIHVNEQTQSIIVNEDIVE
jgi:hypothetical protein